MNMAGNTRPRLAVWKFSSCDGCQLSLLDCEDQLLELAGVVEIAHFAEFSSARVDGPYDLSLVEGSITTADEVPRIEAVRACSKRLVTIGACATAGGIQALRNFSDLTGFIEAVYPHPETIDVLASSTAVADHVHVDFELRGCPVDKQQLLELIGAMLIGRRPNIPAHSQCIECKRAGTVCVMVAQGVACLGPVTQAGCGNLCPACGRGCYGCFGPAESANTASLSRQLAALQVRPQEIRQMYRLYNANAPAFRDESRRHD